MERISTNQKPGRNILLGLTGSVASIKLEDLKCEIFKIFRQNSGFGFFKVRIRSMIHRLYQS